MGARLSGPQNTTHYKGVSVSSTLAFCGVHRYPGGANSNIKSKKRNPFKNLMSARVSGPQKATQKMKSKNQRSGGSS